MDSLKKYITENKDRFEGELPEGHRERFLEKLDRCRQMQSAGRPVKWTPLKQVGRIAASLAAVFVLAFFIGNFFQKESLSSTAASYRSKLEEMKNQILRLSQKAAPEMQEYTINTLENILFEPVPLQEQLPEELSSREKEKILEEYYNQKMQGVKKLKIFLAQKIKGPED